MKNETLDGFYLDFNHNDISVNKKKKIKIKKSQTQYIKVLGELKKNLEKIK